VGKSAGICDRNPRRKRSAFKVFRVEKLLQSAFHPMKKMASDKPVVFSCKFVVRLIENRNAHFWKKENSS